MGRLPTGSTLPEATIEARPRLASGCSRPVAEWRLCAKLFEPRNQRVFARVLQDRKTRGGTRTNAKVTRRPAAQALRFAA